MVTNKKCFTIFNNFFGPLFLMVFVAGCGRSQIESPSAVKFRFNDSGQFKIAQFTDLHWVDTSANSPLTKALILHVLETEKPDLAVVSGDVVTAPPAEQGWKSIAQIFADVEMPWALTLGNHDEEAGLTRTEIFSLLAGSPYFAGEAGPTISGSGNYVLPILSSSSEEVAALLYCFDTHNRAPVHKYGHYDWVRFDQVQWYREQSTRYSSENGGEPLPALAYFHIPIKEYQEVHRKDDKLGTAKENVASPDINSGLFASLLEMGDVMGTFVGHDHNNDYIGIHYDVALAYGRATGIDAYGDLERGSRIVVLHEGDRRFDTWIRTLTGTELTYNYPAVLFGEEDGGMEYLAAIPVQNPVRGVQYRYYEGGKLKQLADIEQHAKLVRSGMVDRISLDVASVRDSFALVFNGVIKIAKRGVYKFYSYADDGVRLSVGGQVVVEKESGSGRRVDGKIALEAGFHAFEVTYYDDHMEEALEVGYASQYFPETVIPKSVLFHQKP